ncbi:hypothetical protein BJ508DRAFT_57413 [Ascobolus immersus RN42]|uniref:Fibronectin type-III domain-containing protein n=1 Tax=Ascobolus immersus RN42 TaxID=1160509 RepID=A0A3N4ICB5_ASCIM|nr:hypothetical protein BJ508DRAFT_57413 [Ascobolus immersus RN42]
MVLTTAATLVAIAWISYRISVLLQIPVPTLISLLGIDLPSPPRVSLHGIGTDSVTLHWSLPERPSSVAKHIIQINGINVGESERRGETSVTVTGLNPNHLYNVRVIAANQNNFQAPGQLIRLRTRNTSVPSQSPSGQQTQVDASDDVSCVQSSYIGHEPASPHLRKPGRDRRISQITTTEVAQAAIDQPTLVANDGRSVDELTAELDAARRELEEIDAQLEHAEEEHKLAEAALVSELELVKERKRDEDAGRQQLRTETKTLEEAKRLAETNKSKVEKKLKTKEAELQQIHDDTLRWEESRLAAIRRLEELAKEAKSVEQKANSYDKSSRKTIAEHQTAIGKLEEDVRKLVSLLKAAEASRDQIDGPENDGQVGKGDNWSEMKWKERQKILETRYLQVYNILQAAEEEYKCSMDAVNYWQLRRGANSETPPVKKSKNRRNRNRKSRTHTLSNGSGNSINTYGAQYPDPSAFIGNAHYQRAFDQAFSSGVGDNSVPAMVGIDGDLDLGLDGPLSPAANALLPSNLFSHEDLVLSPSQSKRNSYIDAGNLPQSPLSSGSPSNSLISSPRSSFHHMPLYPSLPDSLPIDVDAEPTAPTDLTMSGTRKFVNLFNFTRQRGKTLPLDPPGLGSLKTSESRSIPREFGGPSLAPIGTGRSRSGSHNWIGADFLNSKRGITKPAQESNSHGSKTFNPFSVKYDPLESSRFLEPVSPRPSSVASFEGQLPLPGSDVTSKFGWPAPSGGVPTMHGHKLSLLSNPWSGFQSLSANASLTSLAHNLGHENQQPQTRPVTPKLNPAAPAFETPALRQQQSPDSRHDSISINTDASSSLHSLDASSSLDSATTKDSLFTRLSAPKFWMKKEGTTGFFGRKRDHTSEAGGEHDGIAEPLPIPDTPLTGPSTPTIAKSAVGSFFTRKKEKEKEPVASDVEEIDGPIAVDIARPTTPSTSLWAKKDTFFGRKKELSHQPSVENVHAEHEESRPLQQEISSAKMGDLPRLFSKTWKAHDSKEKEKEKDRAVDKDKDAERKDPDTKRKDKGKRRKDKKRGEAKGEDTSVYRDDTESSSITNSFTS